MNQSLARVRTSDPVLAARRAAERPYLDEVAALGRRHALVDWTPEAPRGVEGLAQLMTASPTVRGGTQALG